MKFKILNVQVNDNPNDMPSTVTVELETGKIITVKSWEPECDVFFFHIQSQIDHHNGSLNRKSKINSVLNKEFDSEKSYSEDRKEVKKHWW